MSEAPVIHTNTIADIQNIIDDRQLAIHKVGIKSLRHPIRVLTAQGDAQATVALFDMYVNLTADKKGTHMSRFVELLEQRNDVLSLSHFTELLAEMTEKLGAQSGYITAQFPYFITKAAPVSGVKSLMDYEVTFMGDWHASRAKVSIKVVVPVTSLCPCSKAISAYGAHNQRSHITVTAELAAELPIESLIALIEKQASCELYGVLKRADEKYVTERAYDNPKFVEDLVRDLAAALRRDARIKHFKVESENFESIHNHSAYAMIEF